ncbi:MAG: hypothetical protein LBT59_24160 [Clostridiales bacterium]|jgi:hypothetical protein|nr:hypothetical protein [Clostridiales bacterium]
MSLNANFLENGNVTDHILLQMQMSLIAMSLKTEMSLIAVIPENGNVTDRDYP